MISMFAASKRTWNFLVGSTEIYPKQHGNKRWYWPKSPSWPVRYCNLINGQFRLTVTHHRVNQTNWMKMLCQCLLYHFIGHRFLYLYIDITIINISVQYKLFNNSFRWVNHMVNFNWFKCARTFSYFVEYPLGSRHEINSSIQNN